MIKVKVKYKGRKTNVNLEKSIKKKKIIIEKWEKARDRKNSDTENFKYKEMLRSISVRTPLFSPF